MRRPLLIVFCLLLCISFILTMNENNTYNKEENISIYEVVKYKIEKEKYTDYIVGDYLIRSYSKFKELPIGYNVKIYGKLKNLNNLKYDDFNYGKYLKSCG